MRCVLLRDRRIGLLCQAEAATLELGVSTRRLARLSAFCTSHVAAWHSCLAQLARCRPAQSLRWRDGLSPRGRSSLLAQRAAQVGHMML